MAPIFLWQRPWPELVYRHKVIGDFHTGWELEPYLRQRSISGFVQGGASKIESLLLFYLRPVLTVPLVMLPRVLRSRWMRFTLLTCGVLGVGLLGETWIQPHYAAPITGLIFVLVLQAMRHLRLWRWRGRPMGRFIVWAGTVVYVGLIIMTCAPQRRMPTYDWGLHRRSILSRLQEEGGRHLVMVRYGSQHSPHKEWVYNEANIDNAQVVWAREMDATQNHKLLEYFADRHIWLLEPDVPEPHLVLYPLGLSSRRSGAENPEPKNS